MSSVADWSGLCHRTPRLRRSVSVHRHRYRDARWYLLRDPASGQWQRVNASAYALVRLLDGHRDLSSARSATDLDEAQATSVIELLNRADLLDWGTGSDADGMHDRVDRTRKRKRLQQLITPYSIRIPLLDPDALLTANLPLARVLFSFAGCCLFFTLIALAGGLAFDAWNEIGAYWSSRGITGYSLFLIPVVYVGMKIAHEFAHGLAAKRWGAEVRDFGVVLLLFVPVPYVETSAAWAFPRKVRRIAVGAAGIAAELGFAALATIVFVLVEPGLIKDLAYTTMLLGTISTLLFNGNPLLRYDGYYVLADLIEMPNLASRSHRYWTYLAERAVCGLDDAQSPAAARGERVWLFGYGAASTVYRVGMMVAIALFVAAEWPVVGTAIAISVLTVQLGMPVFRALRFLVSAPRLNGHRRRALSVAGAGMALLLVTLLALPMPFSTHAEGVIWLPEHARVRAGADGTIAAVLSYDDAVVAPGATLARIDNPLLDSRVRATQWELREAQMRHNVARVDDRVGAQVLEDAITRLTADLKELKQEAAALDVTSPIAGRLVIPKVHQLTGRAVRKGDVVAYVLPAETPTIRAVVPQRDIGNLRRGVQQAKVRLVEDAGRTLDATVVREIPLATRQLPSAALGTLGGGVIAVDPVDETGTAAMDGLYVVDLDLVTQPESTRVGGRAYVRFEHPPEPLGFRLYRAVRQLLLSRLSV